MMNLDYIRAVCSELGEVRSLNCCDNVFGNIEVEIITLNGTRLYIASDRGEYLCYVKRNRFFIEHLVPINALLNIPQNKVYTSLVDIVNFVKTNLTAIESKRY